MNLFFLFSLEASNRGSTENSPLLHRPVTYLGRSGQFRTTPTVHLHPSANSPLGQRVTASYSVNNSSPEMERASSLYPRLTEKLVWIAIINFILRFLSFLVVIMFDHLLNAVYVFYVCSIKIINRVLSGVLLLLWGSVCGWDFFAEFDQLHQMIYFII